MKQGIQKGAGRGERNRARKSARKMIRANEPGWKIIDYTGLTMKQVKSLRTEEAKEKVRANTNQ